MQSGVIRRIPFKISLHFIAITHIILCLTTGCNNSSKIEGRLEMAENLLDHDPSRALDILEERPFLNIKNKKLRALHALLYSKALDKNYIDICSDSIIREAVNYYSKFGNNLRKAQSFYYLGTTFYNAGNIRNAAENYLKAKEYANKTHDRYLQGQICNILGLIYYRQGLYTEAASLYIESGKHFNTAGEGKKYANALSYAAKSYYLNGDDSSALKFHRSAIEIYRPASDTTEIINNISAIADILLNNENIGEIAEILQQCYNKYLSGNIPKTHFPIWSKIFYKQKDYSRSIYYLNEYLKILGDNNSRAKLGTFYSLYNIAAECGNYKEAIIWNERYRELKNRLDKEKEENHIKDIKAEYTRKYLAKSYNELNKRHKIHKTITILMVMALSCAILAIIITAKRRIKLANACKNSEIEFYKALVKTLKEHYTELENEIQTLAAGNSTTDNELFTKAYIKRLDALKDLMDYAYISESTPEKFYKRFREYLNQCRQDESSFNDLQFIANKKYHGIIDYLKEVCPNLTQTELNYCSMICLGFTTNAIRVMYGHKNSTSIYNKRSRILEKLGAGNIRLESFLSKTIKELATKES